MKLAQRAPASCPMLSLVVFRDKREVGTRGTNDWGGNNTWVKTGSFSFFPEWIQRIFNEGKIAREGEKGRLRLNL